MEMIAAAVSGAIVGLTLGLTGSGGSILTVPLLVYGVNIVPKDAVAMSLALVGLSALVMVLQKIRQKAVCVKTAALFGGFGVLGAFAGAYGAQLLSDDLQMILFAIVMILSGAKMLLQRPIKAKQKGQADSSLSCHVTLLRSALFGVSIGILTGLLGVGGGFLIVPALVFSGINIRLAMGTSLLIIVINSLAGTAVYVGKADFEPMIMLVFLIPSVTIGLLTGMFNRKIPEKGLQMGFGSLLLITAIAVIYAELGGTK